jgi:uracil-xanthine permease
VTELAYGVDERPRRRWESVLYGWQHTLVDISPFVLPLAVANAIGLDAGQQAELINFTLLAMGVATLIQTTVGNRLPIIQGPSATIIAVMAPVGAQLGAAAMWGGAFAGAALETLFGASRALGQLRRFFPPLVSGVVIMTIGLSLGQLAVRLSIGSGSGREMGFAAGTVGLVLVLQTYGRGLAGGLVARAAVFIAIWLVGIIVGGALGQVDWALVAQKPWLQVPRLFPHGGPSSWDFRLVAVAAIFAGYVGSMVESVGDYVATCAVADQEFEPKHVNRGIVAEGVGCMIATALGGMPCTSYTQNIGIIAATGVASRHVVRVAAVILLLYGLCPKFGALLVAMPRPVLGGVFLIVCGLIVMSGLELLQRAAKNIANRLIAGLALVTALGVPLYVTNELGEAWLAQSHLFARVALTNPIVLGVGLAIALNAFVNGLPRQTA